MDVDWPVLFTGVKTVLDPLASASWPIAVAAVAYGFRDPVSNLIGRVKTLSGWGATLAVASTRESVANQQEGSEDSSQVATTIDSTSTPPPDNVFDPMDREFRSVLDRAIVGDDGLKLAWAIRQRSTSEAYRLHEFHYRLIFGSQIKALVSLNQVGQANVFVFEQYYNESVRADPSNSEIHKDRSFQQWGEFLVQANYAEIIDDSNSPIVRITPSGRQFCAWLGLTGASQLKLG